MLGEKGAMACTVAVTYPHRSDHCLILICSNQVLFESGLVLCKIKTSLHSTQVEALVTKHYDDQVTEMISNNPTLDENLIEVIKQFRDDEQSHHDIGLAHGAEDAPGYNFLTAVIGFGCRNAIWMSERI